jgi:hypothetical protein
MDTTPKKDWNPHLSIDSAANAGLLATGLFIVLFAAATADIDPAPHAAQVVYQERAGRIVVTATRPKTGKATPSVRPSEHGDSVQLAESSPVGPFHFNQHDLNGDNHAKFVSK